MDLLNILKESPAQSQEELKKQVEELKQELQKALEEKKGYEEQHYKNIILNLVIKRYSKCINEKEIKTIEDLKALVQPSNSEVLKIASSLKGQTKQEKAKQAYEKIVKEIKSVPSLGINFWMTIEEMLETKIADYEDKAILLCSVLKAIGEEAEIAIAELNDGSNKPFILIKKEEEYLMLDPNTFHEFEKYKGNLKTLVEKYEENSKKITRFLYKFNNTTYEELI